MNNDWKCILSNNQIMASSDFNTKGTNPWNELIDYCKVNSCSIMTIYLTVNGIQYRSPVLAKNPWILRKKIITSPGDNTKDYLGFNYRVGDCRILFWVDIQNNFSYSQVFNVVNPSTEEEQAFILTESDILNYYNS